MSLVMLLGSNNITPAQQGFINERDTAAFLALLCIVDRVEAGGVDRCLHQAGAGTGIQAWQDLIQSCNSIRDGSNGSNRSIPGLSAGCCQEASSTSAHLFNRWK